MCVLVVLQGEKRKHAHFQGNTPSLHDGYVKSSCGSSWTVAPLRLPRLGHHPRKHRRSSCVSCSSSLPFRDGRFLQRNHLLSQPLLQGAPQSCLPRCPSVWKAL